MGEEDTIVLTPDENEQILKDIPVEEKEEEEDEDEND